MDKSKKAKTDIGYYQNERPEMLKYIPAGAEKILEIGCGTGAFCKQLKDLGKEVWAIEINSDAAEKAKEICDKVIVGDFNETYRQLPQSYFDCIFFNDVLEHLYNPWDVLCSVKSLLSENGVVIASIPNFRYISNLITEILFDGDFRYKPEGGILDDTHIRFFTSKSMRWMFKEQGYDILIHEGIRPSKSWKEKLFILLTFGLLRDIRYRQFATVAKPVK